MDIHKITCQVVMNFISKEKCFTALDISNEIKTKLPAVRYPDVRDVIRFIFENKQMGNYNRTLVRVALNSNYTYTTEVFLYHPNTDTSYTDPKYGSALKLAKMLVSNNSAIAHTFPSSPAQTPVSIPFGTPPTLTQTIIDKLKSIVNKFWLKK